MIYCIEMTTKIEYIVNASMDAWKTPALPE